VEKNQGNEEIKKLRKLWPNCKLEKKKIEEELNIFPVNPIFQDVG